MAVNTSKVAGRRTLHFNNINEIQADVECLAQGPIATLGNWSAGQLLKHLAIVINSSIDGVPFRAPFYIRWLAPLFKKRVLNHAMTPGFRLPAKVAEVLVPPASTTLEEGLQVFRQAAERLRTDPKRQPSPFLGALTHEQWDQLHCRHAELHLSFLVPGN